MNREDFLMLEKPIIYFDNGATTLKPKCVVDKMNQYYLSLVLIINHLYYTHNPILQVKLIESY